MPLTDLPRTPERFMADQHNLPRTRRGYQERLNLRRLMALSAAKGSRCDTVSANKKEVMDGQR